MIVMPHTNTHTYTHRDTLTHEINTCFLLLVAVMIKLVLIRHFLSRKLANLFGFTVFLELINVFRDRLMDSKLFVDRFLMTNLSIVKFSEKKKAETKFEFSNFCRLADCVCVCLFGIVWLKNFKIEFYCFLGVLWVAPRPSVSVCVLSVPAYE